MTEYKKISFELKTKLVENELYIRLTDFKNVMEKILNVEQENEQLKNKNEQLREQIEKMKCCANCKKYRMLESQMTLKCLKNQRTNFCCNEWEMKE